MLRLPPCLLLLTAIAPALSAQSPEHYVLKSCGEPKTPFGHLPQAKGVIRFTLKKDGRADTASVGVLQAVGSSVAGFRSIAMRQLSACKFETASAKGDMLVTEDVIVTGATVAMHPAVPAPSSTESPLPLETVTIPADSFPLPLDDPRLEERARKLRCEAPPVPFAPRERIDAAMAEWRRVWTGLLVVTARIDAKGRPDRKLQVQSSSNSQATPNLVDLFLGCEFAPARYHGVPVPSLLRDSIGVGVGRPGT